MHRVTLAIGFLAFFMICPTVHAELNFCNSAPLAIQTVVGEPFAGQWRTRGWFNLNPGECATVVGGNLTDRYYYAFAETPGGK